MISYLSLLAVIIILLNISKLTKSKVVLGFVFLILSLFSGLRHNVGVDYDSYQRIFHLIKNGIHDGYVEYGYYYFVRFIVLVGGTQQLVFLIFAIITNWLIFLYIRKYSPDFVLSVVLYICIGPFYLASFNGIRQSLAIAIFAFSLKYIENRNFKKYFILIILGSLVHQSILILLPVYFLIDRQIKIKTMLWYIIGVAIVGKLGLISAIINLTPYYRHLLTGENHIPIIVYFYILISFALIIFGLKYKLNSSNMFYNLTFYSLLLMTIGIVEKEVPYSMIMRANNYFFVSLIVLIPMVVNKFKEKRFIKTIVMILAMLLFFQTLFSGESLIPYNYNLDLIDIDSAFY